MDAHDEDDCYLDGSDGNDDSCFNGSDDKEYLDDVDEPDTIEDSHPISSEKRYTILDVTEIQRRQDENIAQLSTLFSLSRAESSALLCYYAWDVSKLHDQWFTDEQAVRSKVGLFSKIPDQSHHDNTTNYTCRICYDEFTYDQVISAGCGHYFCTNCLKTYISVSINDKAAGCLLLRCPEYKCPALVGRDVIHRLASEEEKRKYEEYFMRSYIEFRKDRFKWCPAPGCTYAVEFIVGSDNFEITCDCSHSFCFNCADEPHRPVDCKVVLEWIMKNKSEAENTTWILAYSKPCPKCKRPIEKNQGCNHMTCGQPCGYHFCWLCGKSLNVGDRYHCDCNRYNHPEVAAKDDKRERAKQYLERYTHYYERWVSNHKSREQAMIDLNAMKTQKIQELSRNVDMPETEIDIVVKAWEEIIKCRRVLKWTYAYGYFKLEHEIYKRRLFEHLQGDAQAAVERLHHCVETELQPFLKEIQPTKFAFKTFKSKLSGLVAVTRTYFENLVRGLDNDLSEVVSESRHREQEPKRKRKSYTSSGAAARAQGNVLDFEDDEGYWNCDKCTYINPGNATRCEACWESINFI